MGDHRLLGFWPNDRAAQGRMRQPVRRDGQRDQDRLVRDEAVSGPVKKLTMPGHRHEEAP
jgi:hypothetical protein